MHSLFLLRVWLGRIVKNACDCECIGVGSFLPLEVTVEVLGDYLTLLFAPFRGNIKEAAECVK